MKANWDVFVIDWTGSFIYRRLVETLPITLKANDIKETVTLENYATLKSRFIGIIANRIKRQLNLQLRRAYQMTRNSWRRGYARSLWHMIIRMSAPVSYAHRRMTVSAA